MLLVYKHFEKVALLLNVSDRALERLYAIDNGRYRPGVKKVYFVLHRQRIVERETTPYKFRCGASSLSFLFIKTVLLHSSSWVKKENKCW